MNEKKKTSSAVKRRYNNKAYGRVTAFIPKDIVEAFKTKCSESGVPQAQVIRKAIDEFLAE